MKITIILGLVFVVSSSVFARTSVDYHAARKCTSGRASQTFMIRSEPVLGAMGGFISAPVIRSESLGRVVFTVKEMSPFGGKPFETLTPQDANSPISVAYVVEMNDGSLNVAIEYSQNSNLLGEEKYFNCRHD